MTRGKKTAFDTDVRVPLIITGPGVPAGKIVPQVTQNVDLYPTFVQLAGATPTNPIDGHSLAALLHPGAVRPTWRTVALIEHQHIGSDPGDAELHRILVGLENCHTASACWSAGLPSR